MGKEPAHLPGDLTRQEEDQLSKAVSQWQHKGCKEQKEAVQLQPGCQGGVCGERRRASSSQGALAHHWTLTPLALSRVLPAQSLTPLSCPHRHCIVYEPSDVGMGSGRTSEQMHESTRAERHGSSFWPRVTLKEETWPLRLPKALCTGARLQGPFPKTFHWNTGLHEDTQRRQPAISKEERPQQTPSLLLLGPWTSGLQNCERTTPVVSSYHSPC
jgi:hypothetical protein